MTYRTVNRNQKAEYAEGSRAKGYYVFCLQGVERKGASTQYIDLYGEPKPTQDEAKQSAWIAAREWVAELGEVTKAANEYRSEAN